MNSFPWRWMHEFRLGYWGTFLERVRLALLTGSDLGSGVDSLWFADLGVNQSDKGRWPVSHSVWRQDSNINHTPPSPFVPLGWLPSFVLAVSYFSFNGSKSPYDKHIEIRQSVRQSEKNSGTKKIYENKDKRSEQKYRRPLKQRNVVANAYLQIL